MKKKPSVFVIYGKTASGKDTLINRLIGLQREDLFFPVRETSRPKREGEVEGHEYVFRSDIPTSDFHQYFERNIFNGWFYGTKTADLDLDKVNIITGSVETAIQCELNKEINFVGSLYLDVPALERFNRSIKRQGWAEIATIVKRFYSEASQYSLNGRPTQVFDIDPRNLDDYKLNLLLEGIVSIANL